MKNEVIYKLNEEIKAKALELGEITGEYEQYKEDIKKEIDEANGDIKKVWEIEDKSIRDTQKMSERRIKLAREIDILKIKRRHQMNQLGIEQGLKPTEYITEATNTPVENEIEISIMDETKDVPEKIKSGIEDTAKKYNQVIEMGL